MCHTQNIPACCGVINPKQNLNNNKTNAYIVCLCTWGTDKLAYMSNTGEEWQVARRRKGAARKSKSLKVSSASACYQGELDIKKTVERVRDTV